MPVRRLRFDICSSQATLIPFLDRSHESFLESHLTLSEKLRNAHTRARWSFLEKINFHTNTTSYTFVRRRGDEKEEEEDEEDIAYIIVNGELNVI